MDDGLPWYRRRPRAFIDGVQCLGPELIGAYAVLLDLFYARDGRSVRDDRHLGGVLGCSTRKATSLTDMLITRGKLFIRDGFVVNSVAEKELKHSRNTRETAVKHGRMGAEKRWGANENNDLEIATPLGSEIAEQSREDKSTKELTLEEKILTILELNFTIPATSVWSELPDCISRWQAEFSLEAEEILSIISKVMSRPNAQPEKPQYFDGAMHDHAMRKMGIKVPFGRDKC